MRKNFLFTMKSILMIAVVATVFLYAVACSSADKKSTDENTKTTIPNINVSPNVTATAVPDNDDGDTDFNAETVVPSESHDPTAKNEPTEDQPGTAVSQSATSSPVVTAEESSATVVTVLPTHTPVTSAEKEEIIRDLARSFFHGEWESDSGIIYIFDSNDSTVVLKEKSTGEVLLTGTYESFSDDYSEYELTMTFNGESDSYIAWKYSDTGAVRLIIEQTGATYDLLWRAS